MSSSSKQSKALHEAIIKFALEAGARGVEWKLAPSPFQTGDLLERDSQYEDHPWFPKHVIYGCPVYNSSTGTDMMDYPSVRSMYRKVL